MGPTTECIDPLARRRRSHLRAEHVDGLLARFDAVQTNFLRPRFAGAHEMRVVIN